MPPLSKATDPATPTRNNSLRNGYALITTNPATWPETASSRRRATEDGIKGDSTPEEGSLDKESKAESLTASKQETFDKLAPAGPLSLQCKAMTARHVSRNRNLPSPGSKRIKKGRRAYGYTKKYEKRRTLVLGLTKSPRERAIEQLSMFPTPPREDNEWATGQQELTMLDATETDHPWHAPPASDKKRPSTNQLCATTGATQLYVVAKVQKRSLRAMIDLGATGNFMTKKVADTQGFQTQMKTHPYPLMVVDREPISSNEGMVTYETVPLEMDHVIPIEKEKSPPFGPLYPLSEKELKVLKEYIDDNLKTGHIRPSTSLAGSLVLFVPKKDSSLRLCVNYRPLNNITIKDRYAPPLLYEMNDRFQGARIFTKLDLRGAYALVRIKAREEWKTAFRTCYSLFEYQVMPFGLTNAPASFQRLMNDTLHKYLDVFTVVYLDDILVYSKTEEEHVEHVKLVLAKLKARQLLLKLEKCNFHKQEVEFLGHLVGTKGVRMDPKKELKTKFIEAPILATFDLEKKIILETDSSDFAIRACLNQLDESGKPKPIAYYSRKLSPTELNYDIHDKELIAIVVAFEQWRVYLKGSTYPIQAETLAAYNFTIAYRKGSDNARVDALSRRTDYIGPKEERPRAILKETNAGMQYNELLATIAMVEDSELEERLKKAYATDECAKRVLSKVKGDFAINGQGLIRFKGQLMSTRVPKGAWKSIALDFIVKLPPSKDLLTGVEYNSILVITERLTKYGKFILYLEASDAEALAYTFLRVILADHGLLEEIILDRDKLFTSKFWKSLMALLGTNHKLSTAFHP
ncbi:hypothetical protein V493_00296 [Pseudogymnoascus sp. VKM F-4281 (FW-2241)]|nr:hypothetical protein V493_00296 [Pseudogymnoascus sp. VKM F-4281 (FW-2241)]